MKTTAPPRKSLLSDGCLSANEEWEEFEYLDGARDYFFVSLPFAGDAFAVPCDGHDRRTRHNGRNGIPTSVRERYGPGERAGTFAMTVTTVEVDRERETRCLVEFAVWRNRADGRRGPLWFRGTKTMPTAAAMAVRTLDVWTDPRDRRCPTKVVFFDE